jgi:hypothetical protein
MKAFRIGINDPVVATARHNGYWEYRLHIATAVHSNTKPRTRSQIRKAFNYRVNGWDGRTRENIRDKKCPLHVLSKEWNIRL